MNKEDKLVSTLANSLLGLGLKPPTYPKPKWYQFKLRKQLAYYDKRNWPYRVES